MKTVNLFSNAIKMRREEHFEQWLGGEDEN